MPYLTRLVFDLQRHDVQRDLADCQQLHIRLMQAFPAAADPARAREEFGILFRPELLGALPLLRVLVQSHDLPDWSTLPAGYLAAMPDARGNPAVRSVSDEYARIADGMQLRFRLRANPTKRISDRSVRPEDAKMRGKRVELRHEADQYAWLERKGAAGGFRLLQVAIDETTRIPNTRIHHGAIQRGRAGANALSFGAVVFEGVLEVTDARTFVRSIETGIGSGKAYGFGLLSIALVSPQVPR